MMSVRCFWTDTSAEIRDQLTELARFGGELGIHIVLVRGRLKLLGTCKSNSRGEEYREGFSLRKLVSLYNKGMDSRYTCELSKVMYMQLANYEEHNCFTIRPPLTLQRVNSKDNWGLKI